MRFLPSGRTLQALQVDPAHPEDPEEENVQFSTPGVFMNCSALHVNRWLSTTTKYQKL